MNTLSTLISKKGNPDALIDHHSETSSCFAIYGFEEEFTIDSTGLSMINNNKISGNPFINFQNTLNCWKKNSGNISAFGFISYDMKNIIFPKLNLKKINSTFPLLWFGKPKEVFKYKINSSNKLLNKCKLELSKDLINFNDYENNINKIKNYLFKGDSYQINFTQPIFYKTNDNPLDIYLNLRNKVKPFYGSYLNNKNYSILSFSPEKFIEKKKGVIVSFPMKGTIKRSSNPDKDYSLLNILQNSSKDKAEHLMIVDLIRNDLGKICNVGSVKVDDLFNIQSFPTVHQMISKVSGKLKKNVNETEIILSLFPGGSITGAPKERSLEIIDELENYERGIYTGSIGYITNNGDMDFNIAIRTLEIKNKIAKYPVGGGIVWDSIPKNEWLEAIQKSKILSLLK